MYKIIRPLLSEVTRNKIFVLGTPTELLQHFDARQLRSDVYTAVSECDRDVSVGAGRTEDALVWLARGTRASLVWRLHGGSFALSTPTIDFNADFLPDSFDPGDEGGEGDAGGGDDGRDGPGGANDANDTNISDGGGDDGSDGAAVTVAAVPVVELHTVADTTEHETEWMAPCDGTLRLAWSNAKSVLRSKTITYRLIAAAGEYR